MMPSTSPAVLDRHAEEVGHVRVRGRPPLEPGIGADVIQPDRLALAQQHAEQAVLARQRPDRRLLGAPMIPSTTNSANDALVVGHAERRVPGVDQGARGPARSSAARRGPTPAGPPRAPTWLTCCSTSSWLAVPLLGAAPRSHPGSRIARYPRTGPPGSAAGPRTMGPGRSGRAPDVRRARALPSVEAWTRSGMPVITGASRGLGRALARGLAAEGWSLVIDAQGRATRPGRARGGGQPAGRRRSPRCPATSPTRRTATRCCRAAEDLGGARPADQQRRHARRQPAARARRLPGRGRLRDRVRGRTWSRRSR